MARGSTLAYNYAYNLSNPADANLTPEQADRAKKLANALSEMARREREDLQRAGSSRCRGRVRRGKGAFTGRCSLHDTAAGHNQSGKRGSGGQSDLSDKTCLSSAGEGRPGSGNSEFRRHYWNRWPRAESAIDLRSAASGSDCGGFRPPMGIQTCDAERAARSCGHFDRRQFHALGITMTANQLVNGLAVR